MPNELGLHIEGNNLVSTDDTTPCFLLGGTTSEEISSLGVVEKNTFAAPKPHLAVSKLISQGGMCEAPLNLTLSEWQASGFDRHSVYAAIPSKVVQALGQNLVQNSSMSTTEGWMT